MNWYRFTFIFWILCSFTVYLNGQALLSEIVDPNMQNDALLFYGANYKGSPYIYDDWQNVQVITTMNGELNSDEANLDIYSNKLAVKMDGRIIWVNDQQIERFRFMSGDNIMSTFLKRTEEGKIQYDEIIHEGRIILLRSAKKKFIRPDENVSHTYGSEVDDKPYFSRVTYNYLFKFDDGKYQKTPLSKKAIGKMIPEEYKRVYNRLLKQEKVSFKREEELKSFLMRLETELKE